MKTKMAWYCIFIFTAFILGFSSCKESEEEKESCEEEECCKALNADSMINIWNSAFEAKDTAALRNMFSENALILSNEEKVVSRDSIMKKWIMFKPEDVISCKTQKVFACFCCCCLSYTGTYDYTVTDKSSTWNEKGTFTLIWKTQEDESWKVELFHYEPAPEKKK